MELIQHTFHSRSSQQHTLLRVRGSADFAPAKLARPLSMQIPHSLLAGGDR